MTTLPVDDLVSWTLPLSLVARDGIELLASTEPGFVNSLTQAELKILKQSFVVLDRASAGRLYPRKLQLQAVIAVCSGKDLVMRAATGAGKTLMMVIPALLNPDNIVLTFSPLKFIQENQVRAY